MDECMISLLRTISVPRNLKKISIRINAEKMEYYGYLNLAWAHRVDAILADRMDLGLRSLEVEVYYGRSSCYSIHEIIVQGGFSRLK